ncbi:MAG: hypothetical protein FJ044_04550 [Candidatus Cloacimonetes bacterium]|nr:hypothetical protein [Candidatus Cloacimonadota bacterium]
MNVQDFANLLLTNPTEADEAVAFGQVTTSVLEEGLKIAIENLQKHSPVTSAVKNEITGLSHILEGVISAKEAEATPIHLARDFYLKGETMHNNYGMKNLVFRDRTGYQRAYGQLCWRRCVGVEQSLKGTIRLDLV